MSNQNPLVPQGSLLEQKSKAKPHLRVAYIIVALHLLFLGGLLIQGCKREDPTEAKSGTAATNETSLPPLDSGSLYNTNPPSSSSNALTADATLHGTAAQTNYPGLGTSTAQPAEPVATVAREYVVLKGDSFYSIGKKFGLTASAIARANPGIDSTRLKVGDKLHLPAPAVSAGTVPGAALAAGDTGPSDVYTVKAGDTLGKIAQAHGTSVNEIRALNGLKTDRINVGQKLKLPAAKAATSAAPSPVSTTPPVTAPPTGAAGTPPQ